ncbi:hypothetical protein [Novosphingobium sp. PhB165]|uniref:hypothetical protein n=1 Tax=Novosphingobium sp. PhB165 TaxID=2485105 RepID=UPI001405525D|nr:hypothetical protein [Novosphingobium sp. PhB165]
MAPGRYHLDAEGVLRPATIGMRFRQAPIVAAVVIIPRGQPTRRQLAEQAELQSRAVTVNTPISSDESWTKASFETLKPEGAPLCIGVDLSAKTDTSCAVWMPDGVLVPRKFHVAERALRTGRSAQDAAATTLPAKTPTVDAARLAAAYREKSSASRAARNIATKVPTRRALDTGPCRCCGASGRNGCEHFLPYAPETER